MKLTGKIVQGLLGLVFLGSGGAKLAGTNEMIDDFDRFRYPQWLKKTLPPATLLGLALFVTATGRKRARDTRARRTNEALNRM